MIKKILNVSFQRNGVHGESFYQVAFNYKEYSKLRTLIATFQASKNGKNIIVGSCRVTEIADFKSKWRGDYFANILQDYFDKQLGGGEIYDLCESSDKYHV